MRFSDIDMLGHINNTIMQQYYDIGKVSYCQDVLGYPVHLVDESLIVVNVNSSYYEEVKVDDEIYVTTRIAKLGTKSVTFKQEIIERVSGKIKSSCDSVLVRFDLKNRVGIEINHELRERIIAHEGDSVEVK